MLLTDRVEVDPRVMLGKPVIRGTRITVELILARLSEGASVESILASYPHLTHDDVLGVLDYAHKVVTHEAIVPTPMTYEILRRREL